MQCPAMVLARADQARVGAGGEFAPFIVRVTAGCQTAQCQGHVLVEVLVRSSEMVSQGQGAQNLAPRLLGQRQRRAGGVSPLRVSHGLMKRPASRASGSFPSSPKSPEAGAV